MKGIILAGGKATRLYPITKGISKQLLPIYDKPMVYYPLSVLMLAGIRDILLISTPESLLQFKNLFGDGKHLGISISYKEQKEPKGIADAFILGEDFIGKDSVCLILGDNIFFGHGLSEILNQASSLKTGGCILGYNLQDPQQFGVVEFDKDLNILSIEEKPVKPKSNWVIPGIYFFDHEVVGIAKKLKPSARGEIEITEVIKAYHQKKSLKLFLLGRGYAWLDTGTHASLIDASIFIKTLEERQGLKVGCIEEVAYLKGFINAQQLKKLAQEIKTSYSDYLLKVLSQEHSIGK